MKFLKSILNIPEWQKIFLALLLGVFFGFLLGPKVVYLKPIGTLFINAIRMLIVPVVFTASLCAVLSMQDWKKIRRIGSKAFFIYLCSMLVATLIGLLLSSIIAPGSGLSLPLNSVVHEKVAASTSIYQAIANIIPANLLHAFAEENILQILVFAIFLGTAINLSGKKAKPIRNLFNSLSVIVFTLAAIVMRFTPYGIFALVATVAGEYGLAMLISLCKLILTAYFSDICLFVFFYSIVLFFYTDQHPGKFFKNISKPLLFASGSTSSVATLPVSLRCAEENLGISKEISGFLLPLGTSFNMNGLAIYVSVASVFTANLVSAHLSLIDYAILTLTIVLTSMGAAGIPGSALIVMSAAMTAVGLPLVAVPLIAGVDRIIDMAQTPTNVAGDLFATFIIAKKEESAIKEI